MALSALESGCTTPNLNNGLFRRQLALPGQLPLETFPQADVLLPQCARCHCGSNSDPWQTRISYQRCQITELAHETDLHSEETSRADTCAEVLLVQHSRGSSIGGVIARNGRFATVPGGCEENAVSLLHFARYSEPASATSEQSQAGGTTHSEGHPDLSHTQSRECVCPCHLTRRPRIPEARMATMMPLSAWNLRLPAEPPPPYRPWTLPPYLEDDPAPSYRSRVTTPAGSVHRVRLENN